MDWDMISMSHCQNKGKPSNLTWTRRRFLESWNSGSNRRDSNGWSAESMP